MKEANDFLDESLQLFNLMLDKDRNIYNKKTQFKDWTINQVIGHLHMFNYGANLSLTEPEKFLAFIAPIEKQLNAGKSLMQIQQSWLGELSGPKLLDTWWSEVEKVKKKFAVSNPKKRLFWIGPQMSARSCITARQMETWAHAFEIFDILGIERVENDRIKNIIHLGILTFEWTFKNRNMPIPKEIPFVKLFGPSGVLWTYNNESEFSRVEGSAVDFASVVTQTRNVMDTKLILRGETATKWLSIAQCFAGPPEDPPKRNCRFRTLNDQKLSTP